MGPIKHYRPGGLDVEISEGNTVKLMMIRRAPMGIIARVRGEGRKILWDAENAEAHVNDTEQQFIDRLKEVF
jgi:hypothetical protein